MNNEIDHTVYTWGTANQRKKTLQLTVDAGPYGKGVRWPAGWEKEAPYTKSEKHRRDLISRLLASKRIAVERLPHSYEISLAVVGDNEIDARVRYYAKDIPNGHTWARDAITLYHLVLESAQAAVDWHFAVMREIKIHNEIIKAAGGGDK